MQPKAATIINGIAHWACSRCSRVLPPESFYKDKRSPNGLKAQCKECHTEGSIRTRDKENHRVKRRESARKRFLEDPEAFREKWRKRPRKVGPKVDARQIVHLALRIGAISRPQLCEACGERKRLTAHHDDYQKPLDVRWLCYLCHAQEHRKK